MGVGGRAGVQSKAGGFQVCLGFRASGFRVYLDPR